MNTRQQLILGFVCGAIGSVTALVLHDDFKPCVRNFADSWSSYEIQSMLISNDPKVRDMGMAVGKDRVRTSKNGDLIYVPDYCEMVEEFGRDHPLLIMKRD